MYADLLKSNSVVMGDGGALVSRFLYHPWSTTRYQSGTVNTDYAYTGQMQEGDIYFYNARWPKVPATQWRGYDPHLGRFMQADTFVPTSQGTQGFDRYAYVNNSPINFNDPGGNRISDGCEYGGCDTNAGEIYKAYVMNAGLECRAGNTLYCSYAQNHPVETAIFTGAGLITAGTLGGLLGEISISGIATGTVITQAACADGDCTNELFGLKQIAENVWQSPEGLYYSSGGSVNRIQHILRHTLDIPSRNIHGVFTSNNTEVFSIIDEAWMHMSKIDSQLIRYEYGASGNYVSYIVDMTRPIGYIGGVTGAHLGFPMTNYVQIVLEGTNVISAYPVQNLIP